MKDLEWIIQVELSCIANLSTQRHVTISSLDFEPFVWDTSAIAGGNTTWRRLYLSIFYLNFF